MRVCCDGNLAKNTNDYLIYDSTKWYLVKLAFEPKPKLRLYTLTVSVQLLDPCKIQVTMLTNANSILMAFVCFYCLKSILSPLIEVGLQIRYGFNKTFFFL